MSVTPPNNEWLHEEPPPKQGWSLGITQPAILTVVVLSMGVMIGFATGWIAHQAQLNNGASTTALYDEGIVTSLFDDASHAVVRINISRRSLDSTSPPTLREESGSGFLVDNLGHIATNNHVVQGAGNITVTLYDGRTLPTTKLGTSPADDLALLQIDPKQVANIKALPLADSAKVVPGQMAIAIGSPFNQHNSVTVGVVSGIGRSRTSVLSRPIPDLVQTDAALNPGNSGGPLLNSKGEVIGINSAVEVFSSVQIGVGFAIPSNTLKDILPELIAGGIFKRPWIGISGTDLTRNFAVSLGLLTESGIYVRQVWNDSPAQKATLRADSRRIPTGQGDIIVAIDDIAVASISDMISYLNTLRPGDEVTLTIYRDGESQHIDVTLEPWPDSIAVAR